MPEKLHPIRIENSMTASERKQWLGQESYFRYSWTHAFFNWKRRRIMTGKKVRTALLNIPSKKRRVVELGCGSGDGLFDFYDACSGIEGIQWFGLDLNYSQISAGKRRSSFRVTERNMQPINFLAADLFRLPLADASLDMLLCCEVVDRRNQLGFSKVPGGGVANDVFVGRQLSVGIHRYVGRAI
jgi:ubiquinone/menaquinone biosynthesis C-methylase UbiE